MPPLTGFFFLIEPPGICVNGGIFLFGHTFIHKSLFSVVVAVMAEWDIIINCGMLCYLFMRLCLISVLLTKNELKLLGTLSKLLGAVSVVCGSTVAIGHIGSYAASLNFELGFGTTIDCSLDSIYLS